MKAIQKYKLIKDCELQDNIKLKSGAELMIKNGYVYLNEIKLNEDNQFIFLTFLLNNKHILKAQQ